MKTPKLGRVQLQIMQVLWQHGEASARQISDQLSATSPIAHSTVQTLLRQMEEKGLVDHRADDRVFLFRPVYQRSDVAGTMAQDLLRQVFQGSLSSLVSSLLADEKVSTEELRRVRSLIDAKAATLQPDGERHD